MSSTAWNLATGNRSSARKGSGTPILPNGTMRVSSRIFTMASPKRWKSSGTNFVATTRIPIGDVPARTVDDFAETTTYRRAKASRHDSMAGETIGRMENGLRIRNTTNDDFQDVMCRVDN